MIMSNRHPQAKHRLAEAIRRLPWLATILVSALRWTRARYTAGVVGVVLNERDEVLLVKHVFHPSAPWGLPGGWMERDEAPSETLQRELREEIGLEVSILEPLLILPGEHRHHLDMAFLCRAHNAVQHLSTELLDYRWAGRDELPPLPPFHRAAAVAGWSRRIGEVREV